MELSHRAISALLTLLLSLVVVAMPLTAGAVTSDSIGKMQLNCSELELEITTSNPHPMAYLYVEDDYYFIIWSSSDTSVATVDSDGKVSGCSAGTAVITARTDRGQKASCTVTVTKDASVVTQASLNQTSMTLSIRYDTPNPSQPLYLVNRRDTMAYVTKWTSSATDVATVSSNGVVTAHSVGEATISALTSLGQTLKCKVTVVSEVGKVTINKTELMMNTIGSTESLNATVAVEGGSLLAITWVSSNPGVATVNANGVVTAVADGEATITALSPEGRSAECKVYVGTSATKKLLDRDLASALRQSGTLTSNNVSRSYQNK